VNPSLVLVGISLLTWGVGEGLFLYFLPIYMQKLGASPLGIGSLFGGFALMMMVAHIPAGYLADRIGRRPLLTAAWLVGTVSTFGMGLAPTLSWFAVGYLIYGLTGFVSSPLFSYVTAARGRLTAARAMTLTSAMFNLGAVLGPLSGGWIGEHISLRAIFFVAGGLFLVSTALLLFLKAQPVESGTEGNSNRLLLANSRFLAFLGVIFVVNFAMFLPQPLTPNFLQNIRGMSISQLGLIGSFGSLGNVVLNLILGQFRSGTGYLLAQTLVGLGGLALWRGTGLPWYSVGYFLLGGYRAARVLTFAQVRGLIQQAQMGLAYGIVEAFSALGIILAPLLAGFLFERDPASIYSLSLLLIVIGLIISLLFAPRAQPGQAEI
jgi:DHA1 family tetracycline resistance protein-like MFS transporter